MYERRLAVVEVLRNAPTASPMSVSYDVRYSGGHSAMGFGFSIIGGKRKAPCVAQLR
eukprot:CAMPEP_0179439126 /NCGR_PEP_ID=MMETSP0799-20121207/22771_1 /TAXON_ID=46947 /ORGANISM="Geminigera cryophila, Strain CCMP2564" /LENGTH=56 /DNA_ID=CAMNT_0021221255 /DNA_START=802 /DNA_END=969 /DNA_ORIENTATION=-